jgi:hypothetical protein
VRSSSAAFEWDCPISGVQARGMSFWSVSASSPLASLDALTGMTVRPTGLS